MRLSQRRFEFLGKEIDDLRSCIDLLKKRIERIMKVLAVLAVLNTLWLLVIWFWFQYPLKGLSPNIKLLAPKSSNSAFLPSSSKYLLDILEIICPVGMLSVTHPGVPLAEAVSELSTWSFGADHCASSEGFLVTFTPTPGGFLIENEAWRIFSAYCFCEGFIQIRPPSGCSPTDKAKYPSTVTCRNTSLPREVVRGGGNTGKQGPEVSNPRRESYSKNPERNIRRELMILAPETVRFLQGEGILVALNPTDEGRIGTGRNT
jgi:hypothetical protein